MANNYRQYVILYVDDEETSLKYFAKLLGNKFTIETKSTGEEAWDYIQAHGHNIAILLTDQKMPGMKGVDLLDLASSLYPKMIRILITAYSDMESAIDSVNRGEIYRYISKPWDISELDIVLSRAMERFVIEKERDNLLSFKLDLVFKAMLCDRVLCLGLLCHLPSFINKKYVGLGYRRFLDLLDIKKVSENLILDSDKQSFRWRQLLQGQKIFLKVVNTALRDCLNKWQAEGSELSADDAQLLEGAGEGLIESRFISQDSRGQYLLKILSRFVSLGGKNGEVSLSVSDDAIAIEMPSVFAAKTWVSSLFDMEEAILNREAVDVLVLFILLYHYGYCIELNTQLIAVPWIIRNLSAQESLAEEESLIDSLIADRTIWDSLFR